MDSTRVFINIILLLIFIQLLAIFSFSDTPPPPRRPNFAGVIKNQKTPLSFVSKVDDHERRSRHVMLTNKMKKRRSERMKKNRLVEFNDKDRNRVFSAMLPKGNVPPSGSSSCHNDYPNSVASLCTFSRHIPAAAQINKMQNHP